MTHTSRDLLEFDALKALVGRYVSSPGGRARLDAGEPSTDREGLEKTHADTAEAIAYLGSAAQPQPAGRGAAIRLRFDSLPDPEPLTAKLAIDGVTLEGPEIRSLTTLLDRACDVRAILTAATPRFPRLGVRAAGIGEFRPLLAELNGKIEPDGSLNDSASVALQRIRRDMDRQRRMIQESLERFMRQHHDDGILQEEFIAIRNERFVLPVVAGQKRRVDGIIHAASGTGHTLFIEPLETVDLNNGLVRLREQERREISGSSAR